MVTAYLGDEHSFCHSAALSIGNGSLYACPTIAKVIEAVALNEADNCVIPIENNLEGMVNETVDLLWEKKLYIDKQYVLPVVHNLIVKSGVTLDSIECIASIYQALGQCRAFCQSLNSVTVVQTASTSAALAMLDSKTAAIAREPCEGAEILIADIADCKSNATRFVRLCKTPSYIGNTVSIMFVTKNERGALYKVLGAFNDNNVNITRILSRPFRTGSGEYRFFVDFDFTGDKNKLTAFINVLKSCTVCLQFLGMS